MALYEYRCTECSENFDLMRSMNQADDPAECPTCGSSSSRRVMTSFVRLGSDPFANTNPMMDARMARGAVAGGCGPGCGCH